MDSFTQYKERIGKTLTLRLADAMENSVVTADEASEIAQTILQGVDSSRNHDDLMKFLEELGSEWTLFGPVLVAERSEQTGQFVELHEEQAVDKIENFLKENKLEEAITTAENANVESQTQAEAATTNPQPIPTPLPEETLNQELPQQTGGIN